MHPAGPPNPLTQVLALTCKVAGGGRQGILAAGEGLLVSPWGGHCAADLSGKDWGRGRWT